MTLPKDITTPNWQIDPNNLGGILTDEDDILQCIHNIIFTRKGQVPLNPEFGTNLFNYIDRPSQRAIPGIVSEVVDGIKTWEKRVIIRSISASTDLLGVVTFAMSLQVVADASKINYTFNINQLKSAV